jgi:gamma-glutamyltranspeptidase/glutathione hydrolase
VTPLRAAYRGFDVIELPPPTQGVVALEGLRLLEALEPTLPNMVHCVRLALEDGAREVRDGADVAHLLDPSFIEQRRRAQTAAPVASIDAGTSHLCVIDEQRMTVSLIQSLFRSFGSGVVAPGTGFVLQNRGACFAIEGAVRPGRRPYHTIIPALIVAPDGALGAFGIVGGHLQAQAHVQLVSALVDEGLDPQEALDRSRFRVDGPRVLLEQGLWSAAPALRAAGHEPVCSDDWMSMGCGQVALSRGEYLLAGSDPRMDGYAGGF